jgi:ribulose-5-phosphate 4-epimerase/fuculose-1-phosphate aldolase
LQNQVSDKPKPARRTGVLRYVQPAGDVMASVKIVEEGPDRQSPLALKIAACTRILHQEGVLDYSGHVSARIPGTEEFLIQSFDDSRAGLLPDRLLRVDLDGVLRAGAPKLKPPIEFWLHAEIYRHRPDVSAVAHLHPEFATLFTLVEGVALRPVKLHAARWASGIPVSQFPGHVSTRALGKELAETLGHHHAALMRAHGAVVVAESVPALLVDVVHFEENAKAQFQASLLGALAPLAESELGVLAEQANRDSHVPKLWKYYVGRGIEAGVIPQTWGQSL